MSAATCRRDACTGLGYARGTLAGEEAALYDDLARRMAAGRSAVPLRTSLGSRSVARIVELVRLDRPELSWPVDGVSVLETNGRPTGLEFTGARITSAAEACELEHARARILEGMPATAGEFDKLAYLYESLTRGASYVQDARYGRDALHDWGALHDRDARYGRGALHGGPSATRAHTMAAALLEKNAVCEGYAIALQYLLHGAGIAAMRVTGTARQPGETGGGVGHSWVVARIDGRYSHVDPTWGLLDDLGPQMSGDADWDYLSLSDAEIRSTHAVDGGLPVPTCGAVCDNWYSRGGYVMKAWDDAAFACIVGRQAAAGRRTVSFRVAVGCSFDAFVESAVAAVSSRGADLLAPLRTARRASTKGVESGRDASDTLAVRTNVALRTIHLCMR